MTRHFLVVMGVAALALSACEEPRQSGGNDAGTDSGGGGPQTITVTGDITANTTWTTGNTYLLGQTVFVKNGATLTIQPGVTIQGAPASALIVTTTGKIEAVGTAQAPIVMTSQKAPGSRAPADWGGLVLLGNASVNSAGNHIEGIAASSDSAYGGTDDAHDCGSVKFVRIEFAGYLFGTNNELNGLTTGGCGTGTDIDFVQVHLGADDGVEMFGGTANLKHIVISRPADDGLDWDLGWRGQAQYLIIQQEAPVGNQGFEADNNPNNNEATPRSAPEIANVTLVGSNVADAAQAQWGMHLRRGTAGKMWNFIITGFVDGLIDVDGASSVAQAQAGNLAVMNSLFYKNAGQDLAWPNETVDNDNGFDEGAFFMDAAKNNSFADPQLAAPFSLTAPNFKPNAGSPALSGAATALPAGLEVTTFRGAIGTTDWTAGWTAFPEN